MTWAGFVSGSLPSSISLRGIEAAVDEGIRQGKAEKMVTSSLNGRLVRETDPHAWMELTVLTSPNLCPLRIVLCLSLSQGRLGCREKLAVGFQGSLGVSSKESAPVRRWRNLETRIDDEQRLICARKEADNIWDLANCAGTFPRCWALQDANMP